MSSKKKKTSHEVPLLGVEENSRNRTGIDDITDRIKGDKKQEEVFKKVKKGVVHEMSEEDKLKVKRETL